MVRTPAKHNSEGHQRQPQRELTDEANRQVNSLLDRQSVKAHDRFCQDRTSSAGKVGSQDGSRVREN
ncbi:hypothetical protein COAQ111491_15445 [Comamonas aquatilis]